MDRGEMRDTVFAKKGGFGMGTERKTARQGRIGAFFKAAVRFLANPKLILCLGIAWMITNGWSYVMLGFGVFFDIEWMIWVAGSYLTFLWLPISPRKDRDRSSGDGAFAAFFPRGRKNAWRVAGGIREGQGKVAEVSGKA